MKRVDGKNERMHGRNGHCRVRVATDQAMRGIWRGAAWVRIACKISKCVRGN